MEQAKEVGTAGLWPDLSKLDVDTRKLFEEIISEVNVAPSLRPRARHNLMRKFEAEGREALVRLLADAKERRRKVADYLDSRVEGADSI